MIKLFVYGTLKDSTILNEMFKRNVITQTATLKGYAVNSADTYFDIFESSGHEVNGKILYLKEEEILLVDQWEEVPYYHKCKCVVSTSGELVEALVYRKSQESKSIKISNDVDLYSNNPNVGEELKSFLASCNDTIAKSDMYFLCPVQGICEDVNVLLHEYSNDVVAKKFISAFEKTLQVEYNTDSITPPEHLFICNSYIEVKHEEVKHLVYCMVYLGYIVVGESLFASLYISVTLPTVAPTLLWSKIYSNDFLINNTEFDTFLQSDIFQGIKFRQEGLWKCVTFSSGEWSRKEIVKSFSAEYLSNKILEEPYQMNCNTNIAQYSSACIVASEVFTLEVSESFDIMYTNRIKNQILTLFIVELFIIQLSIVGETKRRLYKRDKYKSYKDIREDLLVTTKNYWDNYCFKYPTARSLMKNMGKSMKIEMLQEIQSENQRLLSQCISVIDSQVKERNSRILNSILLMLTLISIFPVIVDIMRELLNLPVLFDYGISATACVTIFIVYNIVENRDK